MVFKSLVKQTRVITDTAGSGNEAAAMSAVTKYDIIFLDHMMPEKDGIETLHEIKSKADDPRKDYCYAYAMFKLYNKGGGKGSLEPYALYEYKG